MNSCEIPFSSRHPISAVKNPPTLYGQHSHAFFEFDCVQSGRCLVNLGGHSLFLSANDFLFLPPNSVHSIHANEECVWFQLIISPDILEQPLAFSFEDTIFSEFFLQSIFTKDTSDYLVSHIKESIPSLWSLLDSMCAEFQKADLYTDRMLFHLLLTLFYSLIRRSESILCGSDLSIKRNHVAIIARYLLQNYTTASLAGLADQLNYSLSYCSRFVLENTGFRFKELQKKIRMQKAVNFLSHADLPINTIAEKLGYSSAENFMKVFKQEYGMTPSQYRDRVVSTR